jgi:DNA helicase-2/ATP-dependent DNA helicase PcrA
VARVVAALAEGSASRDAAGPGDPAPPTEVELWRCAGERAQAQAVAADLERLTLREGVAPERCCVVVEDVRRDAQPVALALEERAVPHEVVGADAFFQRGEVRDVLAWLRLLIDPADAGAAVRALSRPPVELRTIDVARVTQIARRRKLDMVAACAAATESPQVPPEARERLHAFLRLQRELAEGLDELRPERYVHRLVERLGLRRQLLFAARRDAVLRLRNLARLAELAAAHTRRVPDAGPREFARALAAMAEAGLPEPEATADDGPRGVAILATDHAHGREWDVVYVLGLRPAPPPLGVAEPLPGGAPAPDPAAAERARLLVACSRARERLVLATPGPPSPLAEAARQALGAEWQDRDEELFGPAETLHATFRLMRDELMRDVSRVGTRLAELRFDTDLDIAHAVTRYLELLKLSALIARAGEQGVAEALPEVNERLLQAATAGQREILETSALDEHLLDAERSERRRAAALAARDEPSLLPFLPTRGDGLALSASDIETYRACPLRYKFARVVRIPAEPTLNQRFGILVHQVLERWHGAAGGRPGSLAELLGLLEAGWRRAGLGSTGLERQLRAKATAALTRYHQRAEGDQAEAVWFERPFAFRIGPHVLRGRVDRVDRRPDGTHELIDYKTGRPRSADQLRDDVQLSLYALGAAEAWQLESATQAYWYVLDDVKVEVPAGEVATAPVRDTVLRVGEAILAQEFEPTPSPAACGACDYRLMCPAAER